jgi:hypothetical protein
MENQYVKDVERPSKSSVPKSRSKHSQGAPTWVANLIMLVLGVIIGFVGHWLIAPGGTSGTSGSMFDTVVSKTRHFRGNSSAPVTMIEISDFQ